MGTGLRITEMKYRATCSVKYKYVCNECGFETKWYRPVLEQVVGHRLKSSRFEMKAIHDVDELEKTEKKALKQVRRLRSLIKTLLTEPQNDTSLDPAIAEQYNDLFIKGKKCPNCKAKQPWYPAASFHSERQKEPDFMGPNVVWGGSKVELMGMPDPEEFENKEEFDIPAVVSTPTDVPKHTRIGMLIDFPTSDDPVALGFKAWEIHYDVQAINMRYKHMHKMEHDNILRINDSFVSNAATIVIHEEVFEGITLYELLKRGVTEKQFYDYMLQLCDALECMHKHGLTHNAIYPKNILIGKSNLLKLTYFEEVTKSESFRNDIAMLGALMSDVKEKFMKQYRSLIVSCVSGEYETIKDVRAWLILPKKARYGVVLTVLLTLGLAILLLARRMF